MIVFKCNSLEQKIAKANGMTPYDFALEREAGTSKYDRMMENAMDAAIHNDGVINEHTVHHWLEENETERQEREAREAASESFWNRVYVNREARQKAIDKRFTEEQIVEKYEKKLDSAKFRYNQEVKRIQKERDKVFKCPKCGSELVDREGPYGMFVGCTNYPDCDYSRRFWLKKEEEIYNEIW